MDWDVYKELAAEERQERHIRRQDAEREFAVAKLRAIRHGMMLRRNSEAHYTLAVGDAGRWLWLWDVYPGRQRIKRSRNHPRTPMINVASPWGLRAVVEAAITLRGSASQQEEKTVQ